MLYLYVLKTIFDNKVKLCYHPIISERNIFSKRFLHLTTLYTLWKGASKMANYRNAPKFIHNGSKSEGLFYQLPQKMVEHIFQNFDGKCGNQIKLLIVMLGNKGDGAFRFS